MKLTTFQICWLIAVLMFLILLGLVLRFAFMTSPAIIVSKETTWLTEPLGADGLPDYRNWYVQGQLEGITLENNGAIPFLQAMWPAGIPPEDRAAVCNALGMSMPNDSKFQTEFSIGNKMNPITLAIAVDLLAAIGLEPPNQILSYEQFQQWEEEWSPPERWTPSNINFKSDDSFQVKSGSLQHVWAEAIDHLCQQEFDDERQKPHPIALDLAHKKIIYRCLELPWNRRQFPNLAKRVDSLHEPYQQLYEAAHRTHFFYHIDDPNSEDILGLILESPDVSLTREAYRWLRIRGNLNLGDGNLADAWLDCQTLYRMIDRLDGGSMIHFLVASAGYGMANNSALQILNHPKIDKKLANDIFTFLDSRPDHRDFSARLNITERLYAISMILALAKERSPSVVSFFFEQTDESLLNNVMHRRVDWNVVLKMVNDQFDQLDSIEAIDDYPTKQAAYLELFSDVESDDVPLGFKASLFFSQNNISLLTGERIAELLVPDMRLLGRVQHQANTDLRLMRTAAAMEFYRLTEGEYPESLDDIVGQLIQEIPVDDFHRLPLVYRPTQDGYLLYSVGANGVDDGGYASGVGYIAYNVDAKEGYSTDGFDVETSGNPRLGLPINFSIPNDADDQLIRFVRDD